jgi:REP element-mobilizing transposase RayT
MPRRERLDFKEAIHYVIVRGAGGRETFFETRIFGGSPSAPRQGAPHVSKFERLLAETRDECGTFLCAYCVQPNLAILVLQTAGAPLQAFMQRLCGRYARYLRRSEPAVGPAVFAARYSSKVVAPEYLPHAVRRTHRSPIDSGLCKQAVDYPFSSDRAYRGESVFLQINTSDVRVALEQKGYFGLRGYREFVKQAETPYVANLLSNGSPLDSRIVGDRVFVQKARQMAEHPPVPPDREQLIAGVANLLKCTPADLFSRTHVGTLGRALVAWYGVRSGTATLTEIGQWFSVTGASLGQAIRVQRPMRPDLFKLPEVPG